MQITGELYDEMITSRVAKNVINTEPWVLLFVSDTDLLDSKRAFQNYRKVAKKYEGKVRFGWVLAPKEELLSASFEARFLPQTFYILEGTAYWYRDFPQEEILMRYIDQGL